jgi:hypothetical protein
MLLVFVMTRGAADYRMYMPAWNFLLCVSEKLAARLTISRHRLFRRSDTKMPVIMLRYYDVIDDVTSLRALV